MTLALWQTAGILLGSVALLVILFAYMSQQWWKTRIGRFIVALKLALIISYGRSLYYLIFYPEIIRKSATIGNVLLSWLGVVILTYGAYAFITTIRKQEK